MEKLMPMTDFVLYQCGWNKSKCRITEYVFQQRCLAYALFLKQPITKEMFDGPDPLFKLKNFRIEKQQYGPKNDPLPGEYERACFDCEKDGLEYPVYFLMDGTVERLTQFRPELTQMAKDQIGL